MALVEDNIGSDSGVTLWLNSDPRLNAPIQETGMPTVVGEKSR
jgi:hypothetical protein